MKGDGEIFGIRTFSIQAPETREYLDEWVYHQYLLDNGILTTHYKFVNVILNGEPKGIYALEEGFAEELIESEQRRQGVLLRFNEDDMWQNVMDFWQEGFNLGGGFWVTDFTTAQVSLFREGTVLSDTTLSKEAQTAIALLQGFQNGTLSASEVFDVDLMGKFYAASDLWGAMHGTLWHNMRFYYNPVTGRIEPVLYDGNTLNMEENRNSMAYQFADSQLFADPGVRTAYAKYIVELTQPDRLNAFVEKMDPEFTAVQAALKQEYFSDDYDDLIQSPWAVVNERAEMLQIQLHPDTPVGGTIRPVWLESDTRTGYFLELALQNHYLIPLNLLSVNINGQEYSLDSSMLEPAISDVYAVAQDSAVQLLPINRWGGIAPAVVHLYLPFPADTYDVAASAPELSVEIAGTNIVQTISLTNQIPVDQALSEFRPELPTLEEALAAHPFLKITEGKENSLTLRSGTWNVNSDLILPLGYGLIAGPGTTLRFAEDTIFYTTGPLELQGTPEDPVKFIAQDSQWPGLVVIRAGADSVLKNVIIADTSSIQRGGWILTGGITFYESPVQLDQVTIDGTFAEDSINVVRSPFDIRNTTFLDTASDAFDSDFSDGQFHNCHFENVGGDAVDVSGSKTDVYNSSFINITDKGVSVGEHSSVLVQDAVITGAGIGVASKDLSDATLLRVTITGATNEAIAAYQKKPVFGPASIIGEDVIIKDCARISIIQSGSSGILNGSTLETVDQSFDDLFLQGLLGS